MRTLIILAVLGSLVLVAVITWVAHTVRKRRSAKRAHRRILMAGLEEMNRTIAPHVPEASTTFSEFDLVNSGLALTVREAYNQTVILARTGTPHEYQQAIHSAYNRVHDAVNLAPVTSDLRTRVVAILDKYNDERNRYSA